MFTRFIPALLLASSLLIAVPAASAAPMIQLIVPSYDYTPDHADSTIATGIADNRTIVGSYSSRVAEDSYFRQANGPFSPPIVVPGASFTNAIGINNAGIVSGNFISDATHGFFFDGTTYTQFDLPGNAHTYVYGENDAGDFVGLGIDDQSVITPFISVDGVITTFTLPGINDVVPRAINNLGQVAGYYTNGLQHGFFRDADGTLTYPIDFPGSTTTEIFGLNDQGYMVGSYNMAGSQHAFALNKGARFVSYDYPDASASFFGGINNSGILCGYYTDARGSFTHAFVARIDR